MVLKCSRERRPAAPTHLLARGRGAQAPLGRGSGGAPRGYTRSGHPSGGLPQGAARSALVGLAVRRVGVGAGAGARARARARAVRLRARDRVRVRAYLVVGELLPDLGPHQARAWLG